MKQENKDLLDAIENKDINRVQISIKNGAEIGELAICSAAASSSLSIFKALITLGADLTTCDYPAYMWAAKFDNWEVAEYIASICKVKSTDNIVRLSTHR